ncbi:MAG TPA: 16S rRNA (adenine(1518)-N(6)/adenine(1519)-N(6))-dimethyltransferase RsmA [Holophagaceae bacterium]|nr:16S rRNA (adenine(1518)-N(6)/adenine(1519)-N(6))-dimethyltransferase RsmA [Holophagaceae bacterium]
MDAPHRLLKAKKAFGQNFLVNEGAIRTIVAAALEAPSARILEVGPGPGVLTERLLADGRPLWAVDLDPEAIALLGSRHPEPHFHLLQGDAVTLPLPEGPAWSIVGNLPYNAATPILTRFLTQPVPWDRMVLMFQKEVGLKLMGRPGTKDYGPLSVLAQLGARITRLAVLGPGSFRPAPKVDSVVLQFDPRPDAPDLETRRRLLALLHRAFGHRRKTLSNTLGAEAVQAAGLDPSLRPEALSPEEWLRMVRHWPHGL